VIEVVAVVTDEIAEALPRLVRQLSASAPVLQRDDVEAVVSSDASRLLVARDASGRIVGALTLVVFPIPIGVRAWIEDVVVDEQARGVGIGTSLTREAVRLARAAGARTVDLTSRPSREAANALYRREGFVQRETHVYRLIL
jgi:ribosomal protein S18 acetylase RimI-like enzyme